jgi:hypothetical protein
MFAKLFLNPQGHGKPEINMPQRAQVSGLSANALRSELWRGSAYVAKTKEEGISSENRLVARISSDFGNIRIKSSCICVNDVLQGSGALGLPANRTGVSCRGTWRVYFRDGCLVADQFDKEHKARIADLRRPLCVQRPG